MKIMVSACLLGENCKYNGGNNYSKNIEGYVKGHEVIRICPELLGGLTVPRSPAELVNGEVLTKDHRSVDKEFRDGAKRALQIALANGIELAILQSRSPSCGVNEIYDGTFSGKKIKGAGIFARLLIENGIKVMDAEEIG